MKMRSTSIRSTVAAGILPAVEPVLPARRKGGSFASNRFELRGLLDSNAFSLGGKMPPSTAGKDARRYGFTLIEMMVVMVLLSIIVIGLMAMFDQTQKAFRAGMAQTDQMEGGRMFSDLMQRELEQITPSYQSNGLNFYVQIPNNYTPALQALPGGAIDRTNLLQDVFYVTRDNQTWTGIGYFVRTNPSYQSIPDSVGTLYRFETNIPVGQFNGNAQRAFLAYTQTTTNGLPATNNFGFSKMLDGVVDFRVHCFDTNGVLLTASNVVNVSNNFVNISNALPVPPMPPNEMSFYAFSNNIVPAYVELEVGVLEPAILKTYNSIPPLPLAARANYLSNHAGNVAIFRQRVAVRNVDPLAYTTNYTLPPF